MGKLVTIGIPVYKRLNYLSHILSVARAQDYPNIELLISDNGGGSAQIRNIVETHYDRPFRFRQNPSPVQISAHFNQLIDHATGEYFMLLADDDEVSPNYVSELVGVLERYPEASVAMARQEIIDETGRVTRQSKDNLPELLSGAEFIRAAWHTYEYGYECFATFLARTGDLKRCGGYPAFTRGTHNDDALLIKLCLNGYIGFSQKCTFRWRVYESSHGWSIPIQDLADASKEFLQFLDSDPRVTEFASQHSVEWKAIRSYLIRMTWQTYFWRWKTIYWTRLSRSEKVRWGLALPFIPAYYKNVASTLLEASKAAVIGRMKSLLMC
jgi:GT2 family glycosyltransferase